MARPHVEDLHYTAVPAVEVTEGGLKGARWRVLSEDPDDGAFTTYTHLSAGFEGEVDHPQRSFELFVLKGSVQVLGETVPVGHYAFAPREHGERRLSATEDAEVLLMFGHQGVGAGDAVVVDPAEVPWKISEHEDIGHGKIGKVTNIAKFLRVDPENKDTTGMSAMWAEQQQDAAEWHDAADEGFQLRGDMLAVRPDGKPALIVAGTYNWRPSNARHLPKYSHTGNLRLFRATGGGGWSGNLVYDDQPGWEEMLAEYKARFEVYAPASAPTTA